MPIGCELGARDEGLHVQERGMGIYFRKVIMRIDETGD